MDDGHVDKRANKCIIKQEIKFKVYKIYLENNKIILSSQQRFKRVKHIMCSKKKSTRLCSV